MANDETLDAYIELSDDLCRATKTFVDGGVATLKEMGYQLRIRDKVILALALKIDSAFRALIDDARLRRVEATHHLKTILEAFIFTFVVAKDQTHVTAERLLAEVCAQKEKFFRLNPDRDTPTGRYRADWDEGLKNYAADGILPIGAVGNAAVGYSSGLAKWYDAAYRLEVDNLAMAMSLVASTRGVALLPAYAQNLLPWSVTSRPIKGDVPTIDLVIGYHKANTSATLKLFLSRVDDLIARVSQKSRSARR